MRKLINASLGAVALVAVLANVAVADPTSPGTAPARATAHERVRQPHADQFTVSRVIAPRHASNDDSGIDRTFHPDYSHALTVEEMRDAWKAEVDRVMETPMNLGGG